MSVEHDETEDIRRHRLAAIHREVESTNPAGEPQRVLTISMSVAATEVAISARAILGLIEASWSGFSGFLPR